MIPGFPIAVSEEAKARAVKIAAQLSESLGNTAIEKIVPFIYIYDSFFERFERPDYDLTPGLCCYDRLKDTLKRETFKIMSDGVELQGYHYPADKPKGLAVLAHGFHSGADNYLYLIEAIVGKGYSVLTYDVRGTYSSDGDSVKGMCQSLCDMDNVLTFANETKTFSDMPKAVIGHSWGGYAASSVLALHKEVCAAALLAPMGDGTTIMYEKGKDRVDEREALAAKAVFEAYQRYLFGDYVNYNCVAGLNAVSVPTLIAQGVDDTIITPDGQSVTAYLDRITNPEISVYWGKGAQGSHCGILFSSEADEYKNQLEKGEKELEAKLCRELTKDELIDARKSIDHRRYSEVNRELVELIAETFDKGVAARA